MPKQEMFFEQQTGNVRVEVLKSYDAAYARQAFDNMDLEALRHLWSVLEPEKIYEPSGLPTLGASDDVNGEAEAFLWDELEEQAREDGNIRSFFVVNQEVQLRMESRYVSPDWPSAEAFAKTLLEKA